MNQMPFVQDMSVYRPFSDVGVADHPQQTETNRAESIEQ